MGQGHHRRATLLGDLVQERRRATGETHGGSHGAGWMQWPGNREENWEGQENGKTRGQRWEGQDTGGCAGIWVSKGCVAEAVGAGAAEAPG